MRIYHYRKVSPLILSTQLGWIVRTGSADSSYTAATVQKIVSEILPPSSGMTFSKEARDLLIECCIEFITLVSSEANEISEKEAKKTISCEHVTSALEQLGFGEYAPAVLEAAAEYKEVQKASFSVPALHASGAHVSLRSTPSHDHLLTSSSQGRERKANKLENSGLSMEELERLQAEQFADAAARHG